MDSFPVRRHSCALEQAGFFARSCVVPGAGHYRLSDQIDDPGSHTVVFAPRLMRFPAEKP